VIDSVTVTCPWCLEQVDFTVEADVSGAFVQDCEVCCHPWSVFVHRDREGALEVQIDRA